MKSSAIEISLKGLRQVNLKKYFYAFELSSKTYNSTQHVYTHTYTQVLLSAAFYYSVFQNKAGHFPLCQAFSH